MLINTHKKFIFVSNTKTASTSIEVLLRDYSQIAITDPPALKHMPYKKIVDLFYKLFKESQYDINDFYAFGVFREPVDWVISWFNYRSRKGIANPKNRDHSTYLGNISFEDYVDSLHHDWLQPQKNRFVNHKGENAMNFLIEYDRLEQDFNFVWKQLGITDQTWSLPHRNKSENIRIKREEVSYPIEKKIKDYFAEDYEFLEEVKSKSSVIQ